MLLQHGADPTIRNTDGKSPRDLADPVTKTVLNGEYKREELLEAAKQGNEEKLLSLLTPLNVNSHAGDGRKVCERVHTHTHRHTHRHAHAHTDTQCVRLCVCSPLRSTLRLGLTESTLSSPSSSTAEMCTPRTEGEQQTRVDPLLVSDCGTSMKEVRAVSLSLVSDCSLVPCLQRPGPPAQRLLLRPLRSGGDVAEGEEREGKGSVLANGVGACRRVRVRVRECSNLLCA